MQFPVFDSEKRDGLEPLLKNNVLAFKSIASSTEKFDLPESIQLAQASNPDQMDLFYLDSVLASVGWNKNDDIFNPVDMWDARATPVDKQFNYMHDESDIIGHITASKVFDENNKVWTGEDIPDKFHIVVSSVLYNHWTNDERQERMDKIIAQISAGEWFVSMECLFSKFDYGVITPNGEDKIIARAADTAFLTKHLRAYGGSGEFQGHKLGRVLRNFTFSGKGLVTNPANADSIIFSATKQFSGVTASIQETGMSDVLQKEFDELKADLKTAKASIEAKDIEKNELFARFSDLEKKDTTEAMTKVQTKNDELVKELADVKADSEAKDETIATLKTAKDTAEASVVDLTSKIEASKLEAVKASRLSELAKAGVEDAKALELVEKFIKSDEEVFAELVSALAGKFVPFKKKGEDDDDDKDGDKKKKKKKDDDAKADEAEAEVVIDDDDIEKTEASLQGTEDEVDLEEVRATVSDFLTASIK
jgi:hypothetical protein